MLLLTRGPEPVLDLDGGWTVRRADLHLLAGARHECVDGRLVVTPFPPAAASLATAGLASALLPVAEAAGRHVLGRINLTFSPTCWIQPDVTVLHTLPATDEQERWVPAELCALAVEFVGPGGPAPGGADRRRRCAAGGVPYFMRVAIDAPRAAVDLSSLDGDGRSVPCARAVDGQRLRARSPFPIDLDPARLLPRTRHTRSTSGPVGPVGSQRGTNR